MSVHLRHICPLLALFLLLSATYGEEFPVKTSDGLLFRVEKEQENLEYFWGALFDPNEAYPVDFTLLKQQGTVLRGKPVVIEGRLLRVEASPRGEKSLYYDCWILFDDQKKIPGRVFCARLPESIVPDSEMTVPIGDSEKKILYRQERIRATGFYYRQIPFSDGEDLFNAPAIIAESFDVLSAPTSSQLKETEEATQSHSLSPLLKGSVLFVLLFSWFLFRFFHNNKGRKRKQEARGAIPEFDNDAFRQAVESLPSQEEENDGSSQKLSSPLILFLALCLGSAMTFAQESAALPVPSSVVRLGGEDSLLAKEPLYSVDQVAALEDPTEKRLALRRFRLTSDDTEPFYQLLGFVHSLPEGALTKEASQHALKEVDLFNRPNACRGEAVTFTGNVKRVREIPIHSEKGRALCGLDHYYELYLFTNDSQGYPLVFCTPSLPHGFPCSVSEHFRENIRISGLFYKLWGYQAQGDESAEKTNSSWKAAPLLFGGDIQWYPEKKSPADESALFNRSKGITLIFLTLTLMFLFYRRLRPKSKPIQFVLHPEQKE